MRQDTDFSKGRRGAILPILPGKTRITIRLDDGVLEGLRAQVDAHGGGNYQSLINTALRQTMDHAHDPLATVVRRVVREELRGYAKARPPKRKPRGE